MIAKRCAKILRNGKRCARPARSGSNFCGQHQPFPVPRPPSRFLVIGRSSGSASTGKVLRKVAKKAAKKRSVK
jgi:hypothetical protein